MPRSGAPTGGNWRPRRLDELLLRAALLPCPAAAEAWREWQAGGRLESTHDHRILPAVYLNLRDAADAIPHGGRLKGVYRHTWYRNQLAIAAAGRLLGQLDAAQIPALLLGGASLMGLGGLDGGTRPVAPVDVLVPPALGREATEVMRRAGWRPLGTGSPELPPVRYACSYAGPDGERVDLRWRAFGYGAGDERRLWEAAVAIQLGAAEARTLCAPDQLLCVLAEGVAWRPLAPITWVLDAALLLRSLGGALDWARFEESAARHQLSFSAAELLDYLRDEFVHDIPAAVVARLRATPTTRRERSLHRALMRRQPSLRRALRANWALYQSLRGTPGSHVGPVEFITRRAGLRNSRALPAFAIRWYLRRWRS